jgi:prephenate dehydrogenase
LRIGIAGYGKMGKMIRQQALGKGHRVAAVIDPSSADQRLQPAGSALQYCPLM